MKRIYQILPVLLIVLFSCTSPKSLEKDGGLIVTLDADLGNYLDLMCANTHDSIYKLSKQKAVSSGYKSIDEFFDSFSNAVIEYDPEISLAAYFSTFESKDKISFNSTNEEVLAFLKTELHNLINKSMAVISRRVEYFAGQEVFPQIIDGTSIQVEIPGITDIQRVSNYLLSGGELNFWETYDNADVFQYLDCADKKILELGLFNQEILSDTIEESMSLVDELDALNNEEKVEYTKNNPLFAVLFPSMGNDAQLIKGPCIGRSYIKDTATVNQYLYNKEISICFPRDIKFCWTIKPMSGSADLMELIALKVTQRDGKAPLNGDVITNASCENSKYSDMPEVSIEMNAEGAKIWERITADNIGKSIAIVFDNYVYTYPSVMDKISGGMSNISGLFSKEEAEDLANILKAGRYPVRLVIKSIETVDAAN